MEPRGRQATREQKETLARVIQSRDASPVRRPVVQQPGSRILVFEVDSGARGELVDFVRAHCLNQGWNLGKEGYDCITLVSQSSSDLPVGLVLLCVDSNNQILGFANIGRNQPLALPFSLWSLQVISSKQPGCGQRLLQTWIDLARERGVDYLVIPGYSELGKRLYDKFGFQEDEFNSLWRAVNPARTVSPQVRQIVRAAQALYFFDWQSEARGVEDAIESMNGEFDYQPIPLENPFPEWMLKGTPPTSQLERWGLFREWAKHLLRQ